MNDSVTREAITHKQKRAFLKFVKEDKHFSRYYDTIYILFFTGMRISEFCGLTANDIDLKNKTEAGNRVLPIQDDVCSCFENLLNNIDKKSNPIVSDSLGRLYSGFLCLDKNGMPMVALHWEKYFQHICQKIIGSTLKKCQR